MIPRKAHTMKTQPHNDSLRAAMQMHAGIGGMRIGRDLLTQQQVNTYLLARLEDLEHNEGKMMAALQRLGLDRCDECDEWLANTISIGDRCQCLDCFNWEHFLREDDPEDVHNQNLPLVIKACRRHPALLKSLPCDKSGQLDEPFLAEYRKQTGLA